MVRVFILFLPLFLCGCITNDNIIPKHGLTVCSELILKDCKTFESMEAVEDYAEEEMRNRREVAKSLSDDYRDIAFIVLQDILGKDEDIDAYHVINYVGILGEDPDEYLIGLLKNNGTSIKPGSEYKRENPVPTVGTNFTVSISLIEKAGINRYKVLAGYYCGILCSSDIEYFVIKKGSLLYIESKKRLSISKHSPNNSTQPTLISAAGFNR